MLERGLVTNDIRCRRTTIGLKMQRQQLDEIPGLLLLSPYSPVVVGIEESTFSNFWHGYGIEQVLHLAPGVFVFRSSLNIGWSGLHGRQLLVMTPGRRPSCYSLCNLD